MRESSLGRERTLLGAAVFVILFAQLLVYPGIDTLVTALGAPAVLAGSTWFLAAELAASVVFAWVWGAVSDARGERVPLITVAGAVAAASYAALAVVPRVTSLPFAAVLLVRAVQGAAAVGVLSLAMTMLMDLPGGNGRNMGVAGVAIGAGTALGAPVGGLLYQLGPFAPLTAAAVLAALVAALATRLTDRAADGHGLSDDCEASGDCETSDDCETFDNCEASNRRRGSDDCEASDGHRASDDPGLGRVLERVRATPTLAVPFAFGFVDRSTAGVFALAGTLYLRTAFGLSPAATGAMLFLFFGPFAVFQYPFGALSDRLGRAGPVVVGSVGYGLGLIAVGLAPTVVAVGAAMVAIGVVGAVMSPATMALVTDVADERDRGVAMAGFNAVGSVGFLGGVLLAGTVAGAAGFTTVFLVAGAAEILLAVAAAPAVVRLTS